MRGGAPPTGDVEELRLNLDQLKLQNEQLVKENEELRQRVSEELEIYQALLLLQYARHGSRNQILHFECPRM